jgi:hypothetical protein
MYPVPYKYEVFGCVIQWLKFVSPVLAAQHISPLEEQCHKLKNATFQGRGKNHWPGRCNCIKRTTLLSSRGHFRK